MAVSSKKRDTYDYPPDEFDEIADSGRIPHGVHRAAKSGFRRLLPYLLVVLIAPTVAFAAVSLYFNSPDAPTTANPPAASSANPSDDPSAAVVDPTPSPTDTASVAPTEDPTVEPTAPETSEPPAPTANFAAKVGVFNGAGVNGLAAKAQTALKTAGFTDVTAATYSGGSKPTVSTVSYKTEADAVTAQTVADSLKITTEIKLDATIKDDVQVLLRKDYKP